LPPLELELLDLPPLELELLELLDLPPLELELLELDPLVLELPELELLELAVALLIATVAEVGDPKLASPLTEVSVTKKFLP